MLHTRNPQDKRQILLSVFHTHQINIPGENLVLIIINNSYIFDDQVLEAYSV